MKKVLFGVVLIAAMSFWGCGGKTTSEPEQPAIETSTETVTEPQETEEETVVNEDPEPVAEIEPVSLYAANYDMVCFVDKDGYRDEWLPDVAHNVAAISGKKIIFINYIYDEASNSTSYNLSVYDADKEESYALGEVAFCSNVDVYGDVVFVSGYDYTTAHTYESAFDINTGEELPSYQRLYDELGDAMFKTYPVDATGTKASIKRMQDECGTIFVTKNDILYHYSNGEFSEIMESNYYTEIHGFSNNKVVISSKENWDSKEHHLMTYDVVGDGFMEITNSLYCVLAVKDNDIYYAVCDDSIYGQDVYYIYDYDITDGTSYLVSTFSKHPGTGLPTPGISGFTVTDNYIYCIADDGVKVSWYVLPVHKGEPVEAAPTAMIVYDDKYFGMGHVDIISEDTVCEKCGEVIYRGYWEYFVFNEDFCDNAKKINEMLYDEAARLRDMNEVDDEFFTCDDHAEYWGKVTDENNITSVAKISPSLVVIDHDGYYYAGGAHGMPSSKHVLIDITTGEEITFKDLYKGTEEELKAIVAEKTREDFENYSYDESPYFAENGDMVYEEAYEYVSSDYISCRFWDYGLEVEYPPYVMGPYASGFIYVFISYEDLGITLY